MLDRIKKRRHSNGTGLRYWGVGRAAQADRSRRLRDELPANGTKSGYRCWTFRAKSKMSLAFARKDLLTYRGSMNSVHGPTTRNGLVGSDCSQLPA